MTNNTQHTLHVAVNTSTGEAKIFATKYYPCTNVKGSRFGFWQSTLSGEVCGPKKIVSWLYEHTGQGNQLAANLGKEWRVLSQYEVLTLVERKEEEAKNFPD